MAQIAGMATGHVQGTAFSAMNAVYSRTTDRDWSLPLSVLASHTYSSRLSAASTRSIFSFPRTKGLLYPACRLNPPHTGFSFALERLKNNLSPYVTETNFPKLDLACIPSTQSSVLTAIYPQLITRAACTWSSQLQLTVCCSIHAISYPYRTEKMLFS